MKPKLHFALTGFFYFTIAIAVPSAWAQQQVHLRLVHDTFAVAPIQINGQGAFDFILDTGSDATIVDKVLASRLALTPIDRTTLITPIGKQVLVRSSLRMVSLGSTTVSDIEVLVQEMPSVQKLDPKIHGILGQNFLSRFNYVLDYHQRLLHLESKSEFRDFATGKRLPLEAAGGRMTVAVEMPSLGMARAHLLLDSASSDLVVFRKMGQLETSIFIGESVLANARSDLQEVTTTRINALTIGDQHLHDIKLAFLTSDIYKSQPEDGLLPTILFRALYVNNHERFVILNPKLSYSVEREQ